MKNTLFIKILLGFLLITFLLILTISTLSYQIIRSHYLQTLRSYLTDKSESILLNITPMIREERYVELDDYIKQLGTRSDYRITIINDQGKVMADSESEIDQMENHRDRPEIVTALQGVSGEAIRHSSSLETGMLYRTIPLVLEGEVIGVVRVSAFLTDIDSLISSLGREIFLLGLLFFLIASILIYYFSRRLTRPIRELSTASKIVSRGNLDVTVSPRSRDDIGELCSNFNSMVIRIRELLSEITDSKNALDTIINTMQEGLLVMNDKGNIELSNSSFNRITEHQGLSGKFYWEAIRKPEISEFIREMYDSEGKLSREIVIGNDYYICSGLTLPNQRSRMILLYNITELRTLELVKRDMVANVSHELRSPLTAIKGFAETLEDEVTSSGKEYLNIIQRNIDRLINIVSDLLSLSRLDQKILLEFQLLDIRQIIDHIAHIYRERIKNRQLHFIVETDVNVSSIKGDEFKIEQLLINLLENAIQYTEEGFIKISLKQEERFIVIQVEDSGLGIPEKHKDRIFERFYVVDKSRSKKLGGTGLGLAIVKHIVLLHNGSLTLKSETGKGSCFTVKFPAIN